MTSKIVWSLLQFSHPTQQVQHCYLSVVSDLAKIETDWETCSFDRYQRPCRPLVLMNSIRGVDSVVIYDQTPEVSVSEYLRQRRSEFTNDLPC